MFQNEKTTASTELAEDGELHTANRKNSPGTVRNVNYSSAKNIQTETLLEFQEGIYQRRKRKLEGS